MNMTKGMYPSVTVAGFDVSLIGEEYNISASTKILESSGYNIAPGKIIALTRIRDREQSLGCSYWLEEFGGAIREGFIYVPREGIFLTKVSPLISDFIRAEECSKRNEPFYLNDKELDKALANSTKITRIQRDSKSYLIPSKRLGEDEITATLFGKVAKKYGRYLEDKGIEDMSVNFSVSPENLDKRNRPFATQLYLNAIFYREYTYDDETHEVDKMIIHDYNSKITDGICPQGIFVSRLSEGRKKKIYGEILRKFRAGTLSPNRLDSVLRYLEN